MDGIKSDIDELIRIMGDISDSTASVRQNAAYGAGSDLREMKEPENLLEALCHALISDPSPQVRRAAAISLGKGGFPETLHSLRQALVTEIDAQARGSVILAIGALKSPEALEVLESYSPKDPGEAEILRKAKDTCGAGKRDKKAAWLDPEPSLALAILEVPRGLEQESLRYCMEKGLANVGIHGEGLLSVEGPVTLTRLLTDIRCAYGVRIPFVSGGEERYGLDAPAVEGLLRELAGKWKWREYIRSRGEELKYRFSIEGVRLDRDDYIPLLEAARRGTAGTGLVDSPSDYDFEVICSCGPNPRLYVKPSFMEDKRFRYRVEDVGASINPCIAALLAQLSFTGSGAVVLDPTCGSGTLLVERYLYSKTKQSIGMDISKTAMKAMKANLRKAGLLGVIRPVMGDAANVELWPDCDEILANLPFGVRVKGGEDLEPLYKSILKNVWRKLKPGGRAVLYTAARKHMETALRENPGFRVDNRLQTASGGITVQIWVLTKRVSE